MTVSDGSVIIALCGSVSKICIFRKDVKSVKRAFAATVLVYVIFYVLPKVHSVV